MVQLTGLPGANLAGFRGFRSRVHDSLGEHAFGDTVGPDSFGHSGYAGASFGLADPAHDLTVAAIYNGIVDHQQAFQRRTDLLRAIYRDLDLPTSA